MQVEEPQAPMPIAKHGAWMIVNCKLKVSERGPAKSTGKPKGETKHISTNPSNGTRAARNNTRTGDMVGGGRSARNAAGQGQTATKSISKGKQVDTTPVSNTFSYLQDLEGLQETLVLLEEETVSIGTSKTRNNRKNNKGNKQATTSSGMTSSPTGLFSKGTSVSDQLFVFGNPSSTPSNPSSGATYFLRSLLRPGKLGLGRFSEDKDCRPHGVDPWVFERGLQKGVDSRIEPCLHELSSHQRYCEDLHCRLPCISEQTQPQSNHQAPTFLPTLHRYGGRFISPDCFLTPESSIPNPHMSVSFSGNCGSEARTTDWRLRKRGGEATGELRGS
nr:hypothetical protein Iba_chr07dCG4580 [Ipomoea batatas]